MPTKSLLLGKLINNDGTVTSSSIGTIDASQLSADIPLGTEDYSTANDLPAAGNQIGDQAFVSETNRLYIWTGAGWYNIAIINESPTWDSGGLPEAAYDLDSIGGNATTIQLSATDPEGLPIKWTYSVTDSANDLATITNDSNGTFTITAKSLEDIIAAGYDSSGGVFDVTFKATDDINIATAISEFTIAFALPYSFQGSNYGYVAGAYPYSNPITKFSFTSDGNGIDVGDLAVGTQESAGESSSTHGYASGVGNSPGSSQAIQKWSFTSDGNGTIVGNLTTFGTGKVGQSSSSNGYATGGYQWPGVQSVELTNIEKFPFASDTNSANIGSLSQGRHGGAGQSSTDYGYMSGGRIVPTSSRSTVIDKFPFASDANATNVGSLTSGKYHCAGQSSTDYGFISGGYAGGNTNPIERFPFASDGNSTSVGNLADPRSDHSGQSSTTHGYIAGGTGPLGQQSIQKFPYASVGAASTVGSLLTNHNSTQGGSQY